MNSAARGGQGFYEILYEDAALVAVNKASGVAVCAERWEEAAPRLDRLLEAALGHKVYIVHRLDKETSGVIVFAKNEAAHKKLNGLFARRCVEKTYIAIVHGKPAWREETCELPLLADGNKKHQTIVERFRGKPAVTKFSVVCMAGNYSALLARPLTGRTHQIRVSLARLRHPVVCDELYGTAKPLFLSEIKRSWRGDRCEERPLIQRLGLHASRLGFPDGQVFEAPPPKDMKATLRQFEKNGVVYEHDSMA